jgi:hypothetical protein
LGPGFGVIGDLNVGVFGNVLLAGAALYPNGPSSITSPNGQYTLTMQGDGNLVLVDHVSGQSYWASNTAGHPGAFFSVQKGGNLLVQNADGAVQWASWTQGHAADYLVIQDDGNVVLVGVDGSAIWNVRQDNYDRGSRGGLEGLIASVEGDASNVLGALVSVADFVSNNPELFAGIDAAVASIAPPFGTAVAGVLAAGEAAAVAVAQIAEIVNEAEKAGQAIGADLQAIAEVATSIDPSLENGFNVGVALALGGASDAQIVGAFGLLSADDQEGFAKAFGALGRALPAPPPTHIGVPRALQTNGTIYGVKTGIPFFPKIKNVGTTSIVFPARPAPPSLAQPKTSPLTGGEKAVVAGGAGLTAAALGAAWWLLL